MEIAELNYYPIKSCAGLSVPVAEVGPRGINHDREFMVINPDSNDPKGNFRTQRSDKALALVRPNLTAETLYLEAQGMQSVEVPIQRDGNRTEAGIWYDKTEGIDQGELAASWFSALLNKPSRLVRMPDDYVRKINRPKYQQSENDQVGFADRYNFLLISEESLIDLNNRLAIRLPMNRFRPNIVVKGAAEAYGEDSWEYIQMGSIVFKVARDCARCAIPATDQLTLKRTTEPTKTLVGYRPLDDEGSPYFGQNLIHLMEGTLRVGDEVQVLSYKKDPSAV